MSESPAVLKMIGHSVGAVVAASLVVLLIGMFVFGFQFAQWTEWEGRVVGMAGTIAGAAGAVVGLLIALRAERRANK